MQAQSPPRPILPAKPILRSQPVQPVKPIQPARAGRRSGVIQGAFAGGRPRMPMVGLRPGSGPIQPSAPMSATATPLPPGFDGFRPAMPGQRMPEVIQRKMESVFKASFSDVRIHVGPQAGSIGALAFTQGSDVFFAYGQYNPTTPQGQRLLGQQLAHVVQQRSGRVRNPFGAGMAVVTDPLLKAEAEMMGTRVAMLPPAQPKRNGPHVGSPGSAQKPSPILPSRPGIDSKPSQDRREGRSYPPRGTGPDPPQAR